MAKKLSKIEIKARVNNLRSLGKSAEADALQNSIIPNIPKGPKGPVFADFEGFDDYEIATPVSLPKKSKTVAPTSGFIKPLNAGSKPSKQDLVMYGFRIGKDDLEALKELSIIEDRPVGSLIRKAVKNLLQDF